jgi:hypothetical protein
MLGYFYSRNCPFWDFWWGAGLGKGIEISKAGKGDGQGMKAMAQVTGYYLRIPTMVFVLMESS